MYDLWFRAIGIPASDEVAQMSKMKGKGKAKREIASVKPAKKKEKAARKPAHHKK